MAALPSRVRDGDADVSHDETSTLPNVDLKRLVEDDIYAVLKQHFLRPPGRGRPVTLPPSLPLTQKLLVQLHYLKNEDDACTFADVQRWLCKLFPSLENVTLSRITHHVTAAHKSCLQMKKQEALTFLDKIFDFHALPLPLSSLGLNRLHLLDLEPFSSLSTENHLPINNAVVRALEYFQNQENKPLSFVLQWIRKLSPCSLNDGQLRTKVLSTCKKIRALVKNKKNEELTQFLQLPFISISNPTAVPPTPETKESVEVNALKVKECRDLRKANEVLETKINDQNVKLSILQEECIELREKKNSLEASEKQLKDRNKENNKLLNLLKEKENQLLKLNNSKVYKQNSHLRTQINDAIEKIDKLNHENNDLRQEASALKRKVSVAQTAKSNFKRKFEKEKEKNQALSEELISIDQDADTTLKCEKGNKYKDQVRLAYMDLQGKAEVAASKCSEVVQIVSKHIFGQNFTKEQLPSSSSALNFADEGHHIAMHQVVDRIKNTKHYTYASDGTSRQKKHFLERHIILEDKTQLSVGFTEIASDDAKTLLEQTIEMLNELSDIYCLSDELTKDEVFKELLSKMKCLLSDRAAVNKLFNKKMSEFRQEVLGGDVDTHFLYCNAHFLLGLVRAVEEAVKDCEDGFCLGRDKQSKFQSFASASESAALRLIRTAAECLGPRGDEKSGSREEWLAFCDIKGITSKFVSHRSNRFNNVFENAAATIFHLPHIIDFISNFCTHSNLKLQSVLADSCDEKLVSIVGAIALFNVVFSESYWMLMNSQVPYGDFPQYVKKLDAAFEYYSDNDICLDEVHSIFDDFQASYPAVKTSLFDGACSKELWGPIFKSIVLKSHVVLKRQLSDFLEGGVFGGVIDEETQKILNTCPLTNLSGERLFGDLDYDMLRRRNATTHHRSTVTMWKHNRTAEWLEKQSASKKKKIFQEASRNRQNLRKRHLDRVKKVREEIKKKICENQQKAKEKEIKDAATKTSILDGILGQGGVCYTMEDLNNLYKKCSAEDLKCQIRYRKVFLNQKHLRLAGTKEMLYKSLALEIEKGGSVRDVCMEESDSESET